jgi:hypothetical protein
MSTIVNFETIRSRKNIPCLWEEGGSYTNTGKSIIITGKQGQPKKPIYIKNKGTLACDQHALIPIEVGDHIIKAYHHRGDFDIRVYCVMVICGEKIATEEIASFSEGEWLFGPKFDQDCWEGGFSRAIKAAEQKAMKYHCRCPYYIAE